VHSKFRLSQIIRKPASAGAIVLALVSATTQMVALAAASGWTTTPHGNMSSTMASAVIRSLQCGGSMATKQSACQSETASQKLAADPREHVVVPLGDVQCPNSGPGVACASHSVKADSGNSAVPDGLPACPVDPNKSLNAPGSCTVAPAAPVAAGTTPGVAQIRPGQAASPAGGSVHSPEAPSAPAPPELLTLTTSSSALNAGDAIRLDAHSTVDVSHTDYAIEIFDKTTSTLIAACTTGTECQVSFSAKSGLHTFIAYVVPPTKKLPRNGAILKSNPLPVRFLGVSLAVQSPSIVAPGKGVTFVANATEDVGPTGFVIEMHDAASGARLSFCAHGTTCSMTLVEPAAGVHSVIATLGPSTPQVRDGNPDVHAASTTISATWLAVRLDAAAHGGAVYLTATANADLSQTPYSIYIFDHAGAQVGSPCNAAGCTAWTPDTHGHQTFVAVIARMPLIAGGSAVANVQHRPPATLDHLDVQAASGVVKPSRLLWGVDSCQALTNDPSGGSGLLPQVKTFLGAPDFWARYLPNTANCGGLSASEIAAAHANHMGILPIYNDYDCSAVSGNGTGASYAEAAVRWLQNDLIPQGTAIAIDIEPVGAACPGAANVDTGFIQGWYDVLIKAGYVPTYYGNTAPGSAFANAWCATTHQRPEIANNSFLWSFEPSLGAVYGKGNAPAYNPYSTGCPGHYAAWQFILSAGSTPDVDQDEVSSDVPLWYP
jgi:hypothetical protein